MAAASGSSNQIYRSSGFPWQGREPGALAPLMELELWIVRHGETDANRAGIIQGQSESSLSELGASQAVLVAAALSGIDWWRIVSSDLGRCKQTARLILTPPPDAAGEDPADESAAASEATLIETVAAPGAAGAAAPAEPEGPSAADAGAGTAQADEPGVLRVGSHVVQLEPRIREMTAGIYEMLPRGTAFKKALKIKAEDAGLSVEAYTKRGISTPNSRVCKTKRDKMWNAPVISSISVLKRWICGWCQASHHKRRRRTCGREPLASSR